ncbi:MAG: hypothetical protein QHH75_14605 [Bacillota bacterium]|nr:hypothetical protein [Bacillota bacterium]
MFATILVPATGTPLSTIKTQDTRRVRGRMKHTTQPMALDTGFARQKTFPNIGLSGGLGTPYVENPSPEIPAHLNIQGTATLLEQVSRNIWKAKDIITGKIYYLLIDPKIPQAKYLGVGVTVKFVGAEIEAGSLPGPAIDATNGEFFEVLLPDFE